MSYEEALQAFIKASKPYVEAARQVWEVRRTQFSISSSIEEDRWIFSITFQPDKYKGIGMLDGSRPDSIAWISGSVDGTGTCTISLVRDLTSLLHT